MNRISYYFDWLVKILVIAAVIYALYKTLEAVGLLPRLNYSTKFILGDTIGTPGSVETGTKLYAKRAGYLQDVDPATMQAAIIQDVYLAKDEYAGLQKSTKTVNGTKLLKISSPHVDEPIYDYANLYYEKS